MHTVERPPAVVATPTAGSGRPALTAVLRSYWELTKPGITRMVLITTGVGFYLGATAGLDLLLLLNTLVGTALAASGANSLNQVVERSPDALMKRTANRPLPSGRLSPVQA
jgi:protoheme IX farnesyltransferase